MLPRVDIVRWRAVAPWADDDDVEQDLVITTTRILAEALRASRQASVSG